jgi:hypothetical protein
MTGFRAEHGLHAFQVLAVVPSGSKQAATARPSTRS